jgi:hypothetical protein
MTIMYNIIFISAIFLFFFLHHSSRLPHLYIICTINGIFLVHNREQHLRAGIDRSRLLPILTYVCLKWYSFMPQTHLFQRCLKLALRHLCWFKKNIIKKFLFADFFSTCWSKEWREWCICKVLDYTLLFAVDGRGRKKS